MKFHTAKTILENLTGEINATNIKKFEKNLFFNTSFFVYYLSYLLVAKSFLQIVSRQRTADSMTKLRKQTHL